jgi:hypothetical protein
MVKNAKISSFGKFSLEIKFSSILVFSNIQIDSILSICKWQKSLTSLESKPICFEAMSLEKVMLDERDYLFFQIKAKIRSFRKKFNFVCSNKSCENIPINAYESKLSKCHKCLEFVFPKTSLKLEVLLGKTTSIKCISFDEIAERLSEFVNTNTILYFKIKKTISFFNVSYYLISNEVVLIYSFIFI